MLPGRCIATKACISAAPRAFAMGDGGTVAVVDVEGDSEDDVVFAAESCPVGALAVYRDGEQLA